MNPLETVGILLLLVALPLLRQYRDSFALPVIGLICFVIGALLLRWSKVNRRK
ncbi:MAG: hypothetical protein HFG02_05680 [Oscillibacter sp.]|nr:hypothetical protein [Oscillibacter sp.]